MKENWDVYNINREKLGKIVRRDKPQFGDGEYHLIVNIWIFDNGGKLLVQRRALQKDFYPGVYAAHGGSVLSGENSIEAAIRETSEEIGVALSEDDLHLFSTKIWGNGIFDNYIARKDVRLDELVIDEREVHSCEYMTIEEILNKIKDNDFFDYLSLYSYDYFEQIKNYINVRSALYTYR